MKEIQLIAKDTRAHSSPELKVNVPNPDILGKLLIVAATLKLRDITTYSQKKLSSHSDLHAIKADKDFWCSAKCDFVYPYNVPGGKNRCNAPCTVTTPHSGSHNFSCNGVHYN